MAILGSIFGKKKNTDDTTQTPQDSAAVNGFRVIKPAIGKEEVQKASQILLKYKQGKARLEQRIVENEQWYKLRHWECMRDRQKDVQPVSAWLFNVIANKHADAMDNFPAPTVLPREEGDKPEAEKLTSIIPVILDQNDFEQTYSDVWDYKLKAGTGVYGVFWDKSKLNGLGDITIKKMDLLNLFWQPGITDIQASRHLFHVELQDNEVLESMYPQLKGKLGTATIDVAKYVYDDTVDTSDKSLVVDWYYKKNQNGRTVLHYCKYVNDTVLFATENDSEPKVDENGTIIARPMAETGWYDHGLYPFIFDPMFRTEGTPTGFSYIDVGKDVQAYIDRGNQAILQNMLAGAKPRYFVGAGCGVNEEEFSDLTKDIVHVDGSFTKDAVAPIDTKPLSDVYVAVINNKIEELKEITGNRDVSTGGAPSGVTAASALAALQETASKQSRDHNKAAYRAYRRMILMVIELIRQFYDLPRCFRIMGQDGAMRFVQYSNESIRPQSQGNDFDVDLGYRIPLFDIEVTAQKASPYSKMSQNELALQFYQSGFFFPQNADAALACIDMMDFDRKQFVMQKIAENGTMFQTIQMMQQQMLQLGAIIDSIRGSDEVTKGLAQQFGMSLPQPAGGNAAKKVKNTEVLGGESGVKEPEITRKARQRVAELATPR